MALLALGCPARAPKGAPGADGPPAGFTADTRVEVTRGSETRHAKGFLAVDPSHRMRLEVLDPFGRTRLTLVLTEGLSTLVAGETYAEADEGALLIARLLDARIGVDELLDLLLDPHEREGRIGSARYRIDRSERGRALHLILDDASVTLEMQDLQPLDPGAYPFVSPAHGNARPMPPDAIPTLWEQLGS